MIRKPKAGWLAGSILGMLCACFGVVGLVVIIMPSSNEQLVMEGNEPFESMRLNAYWTWAAVKDLGFTAPQGWSQLYRAEPIDPWGTEFRMVVIDQPIEDVPAEITRGYEFGVPVESSGWFIAVSSAGPDATFGTRDDLLHWRANSSDDGMMIGSGNNLYPDAWPGSFDPY